MEKDVSNAEILDAINKLSNDVSGIKTDVSGLKTDVSGLKTDVSGLKTDVSVLKADVSVLKTDFSELKERLSNLEKFTIDIHHSVLKIEVEHGEKLSALFDAFTMHSEKFDFYQKQFDSINKHLQRHDDEIYCLNSKVQGL